MNTYNKADVVSVIETRAVKVSIHRLRMSERVRKAMIKIRGGPVKTYKHPTMWQEVFIFSELDSFIGRECHMARIGRVAYVSTSPEHATHQLLCMLDTSQVYGVISVWE